MALSWLGGSSNVGELIARRKFDKAIDVIESQLQQGGGVGDQQLRRQLADVLVMASRGGEAVPVLRELADEYAAQGEAAKAIALLKKIERIQPGRSDVEARLARLIKDKNQPRIRAASSYAPKEGVAAEGYEPAGAIFSAEHFEEKPAEAPSQDERIQAVRQATWQPTTREEEPGSSADLPSVPPPQELPAVPPAMLPTVPPAQEAKAPPLDAIQDAMAQSEAGELPTVEPEPQTETVETPLFQGFSQEELQAVIHGLELRSYEPGDIILTEGDPGNSLFVLTTGVVKAFVKNSDGLGQRLARTMSDGAFFGEISILSGKPRTATITAVTPCELLELDRPTLDGITQSQPGVKKVLEEFYIERAAG